MPSTRNAITSGLWALCQVEDHSICATFDCGNADLNDYFHNDTLKHKKELLTQTYALFNEADPSVCYALLDFCNDAISVSSYKGIVKVPHRKQYSSWPAVKLTRLGVAKEFHRNHVGSKILNMAKQFFVTDNRTGCRFITVDAYKDESVLRFYRANDFKPLPEQTSESSIAMFYDLKRFRVS